MADALASGESLALNGSLASDDGRFQFTMQGDGNAVLYGPDGRYRWDSGTVGRPVERALMQSDGNFLLSGPGGSVVWATRTSGNPGARMVIQDDGNLVLYSANAAALWASNTPLHRRLVPGFLPSTAGFHFPNSFPAIPHGTIQVGVVQVPIGDASKGLCGGMAYAARDYHEAGATPPEITTPPTSGALYDHIVKRLYMSFDLPVGPWQYLNLMNPDLPDHETDASRIGLAPHGRAWVMVNEAWPAIRADLDAGRLSPLALVCVKSHDPFKLGLNHQILAYGYELDGTDLRILVYDPNNPDRDDFAITLNVGDPQHTTPVGYSRSLGGDGRIWCFFRTGYSYVAPPVDESPPGPHWRGWESLGGVLASSPDVCSWAPGRLDVFVRGTADDLQHRWYDGGWSGWETLGGALTSDPAAVSWGPGRIDVFARGVDGTLAHRWYDGNWSAWESLGGAIVGGPDVASWGAGRLDVFARGTDGTMVHKWYDRGWSDWESLGPAIASDPTAVSWGSGRIDVFAPGTDGTIGHRWYDGGWSGWESLGASLAAGVDAASWAPDRLDLFARGHDDALWHRWYDGNWSGWESLGGRLTSAPSAVSWGHDRVDVFGRFADNALWHRWYG